MKVFQKAASAAALAGIAAVAITLQTHAQTPDYLGLGEAELGSGEYDLAGRDLIQAFNIAKQNQDVPTLIRITGDLKTLLEKASPPPQYVSDYEADVVGAYLSAFDIAHDEACYDPAVPNSGSNISKGQADLQALITFYAVNFGTPDTGASGLAGKLSYLALAAESYLNESTSGDPACPPAPPPPAPVPVPVPVPPPAPSPSPNPTNTSAGPSPTNTSGPAPTNTGSAPNPTGTSG